MGFLMLAGLIGSIVYSTHCVKNDIKAEVADSKCKPSLNKESNRNNVRTNFTVICKRAGIKLSDKGLPLDERQCRNGMEYLKYRGYDPESVEYFKKLFHDKYLRQLSNNENTLSQKHSQLKKFLNTHKHNEILVTFRRNYYGNESATSRMEKIMKNSLWRQIVDNYTFVESGSSARYTEVWNLRVPRNFFNSYSNPCGKIKESELYNEVCWLQGLDNGSFMN